VVFENVIPDMLRKHREIRKQAKMLSKNMSDAASYGNADP
jgi:hypothetical protein